VFGDLVVIMFTLFAKRLSNFPKDERTMSAFSLGAEAISVPLMCNSTFGPLSLIQEYGRDA